MGKECGCFAAPFWDQNIQYISAYLYWMCSGFCTCIVGRHGTQVYLSSGWQRDSKEVYTFKGFGMFCIIGNLYGIGDAAVCFDIQVSLSVLCFTTPVYEFYITQDVFRNILAEGHPVLYFAASSALTGMLAGLLSLFAMYLSLFIKNRLFVVCVPMIAHYFVDNYIVNWLKLPDWLSISYTFTSEIKMWQNSYISVLYACGMAGVGIGLFTVLITKKIRKGL